MSLYVIPIFSTSIPETSKYFLNDFTSNNFSFYAMDDDGKDLNCKYEEISEWPVNIKS